MALSTNRTLITQTGINTHQVLNVGGLDSAGIATFLNFKTGLSNVHSIGFDVGTAVTIRSTGNAAFSGIVTAQKFVGDISEATGAAAGLGTALSQTQTDPHNKIYYTNKVLSISTTTTIDHPATTNIAYTQYEDIKIEDGHDLIIKDGDELRPDVLGLSTTKTLDTNNFPNGLRGNLIGNVTGDVTGNVTGNVTGDATGLSGNPSINTSGIITATSFSGSGVNLTDNIVIGTAGKGIDYSAQTASGIAGVTVTSEIFVHYEEGTFTPFLSAASSAPSVTYGSERGGKYTRIGNMVFYSLGFQMTAFSGGSGNVYIGGFPYIGSGNPGWDGAHVFRDCSAIGLNSRTNQLGGWMNESAVAGYPILYLQQHSSTSTFGAGYIAPSSISTGRITVHGHYKIG